MNKKLLLIKLIKYLITLKFVKRNLNSNKIFSIVFLACIFSIPDDALLINGLVTPHKTEDNIIKNICICRLTN